MTDPARPTDQLGGDDKRARLAELLRRRAGHDDSAHPLSHGQQALWFLHQLVPGTAAYNVVFSARVGSPLDVAALARALRELVTRHPILRASFEARASRPVQRLRAVADVAVEEIDARDMVTDALPAALAAAAQRPFDLQTGPLVRASVFTRAADDHVLVLAVHHLVVDGWSFGLLLDDLFQLYAHETGGGVPPAAAAPAQYLDFVRWQSEMLASAEGARLRTYWNETLSGELPVLDLPTVWPRPAVVGLRGSSVGFALDRELTASLKRLAAAEGTTPFVVMLAALQALLSRYTGQTDILVGSPVAGRSRSAFERIVGNCMNMVVLRGDLSDDPPFRAFVARMRERVLGALAHQDYPFSLLVESLKADRDLSRMPVFQVTFNYLRLQTATGVAALVAQDAGSTTVEIGGLRLQGCPVPQQEGQFDLALEMTEVGSRLQGRLKYDTALFDASTVTRMVGHFETLLRGAVTSPELTISELPLLTEPERQSILVDWNLTERAFAVERGLHELLEAQAARKPDAIAVVSGGISLTYAELNRRVNRLAHVLLARGVRPGALVGIAIERSIDLLVAVVGVLKAGGAYVPLDPAYPPDRLLFMLSDAEVSLLLTQDGVRLPSPPKPIPVLRLDADAALLDSAPDHDPVPKNGPEDLAYVIYTSGSTGTPKGVEIPRRALVNLLLAMAETPGLVERDVLVAVTSLSFDIAALELLLPLTVGACVVVAARDEVVDGMRLGRLLDECGATVMQATPSTWRLLLDAGWSGRSGLRAFCGGEALSGALAAQLTSTGANVWNLYGPTETTIWSTVHHVRRDETVMPVVPIGRPIANTRVYVLDAGRRPVPSGVPGELYIGGLGLARGYRGRPDLTGERFVSVGIGDEPPERLYRTGDLVRARADGLLEYLGRLDQQVKVRGFRIELGEVEAALLRHPSVRAAVVVARPRADGDARLAAYVVGSPAPGADELRRTLQERLPEYMIPATFTVLDALPLTPNGKVDRRRLPAPDPARAAVGEDAPGPRTATERRVAGIWSDVLAVPVVGVNDNFFDLGGHSLLATRVMTRIRREFSVDLPLRRLFEAPTVAGLAAAIDVGAEVEPAAPSSPRRTPRPGPAPASFAQRRIWFFDQVAPGSTAYNLPLVLELSGPLDRGRLEAALATLLDRHEVLRTTLELIDGELFQIVGAPRAPVIAVSDLSGLAPHERDEAVRRQTTDEARRSFDLARGPLVRMTLLTLAPDAHVLMMTVHHAVLDGWSIARVVHELAETYAALSEGRPSRLPALPMQYGDFAEWQRAWLTDGTLAPQLAYWRQQLAGSPELLDLPADRPHPPAPTFEASVATRVLSADVARALRGLGQREGTTMFMTALAAFKALLFRYTGQEDLVVGSPIAGRNQPGTDDLLGVFINTLVLRTDLSGDPTFRQLLARVREVTLGAYAHQDVPFERLVEELRPGRHPDRNPLFQVLFNLLNFASSFEASGGGVRFALRPSLDLSAAAESLTLYAFDGAAGLHLWLVYSRERFDTATAERILGHFETLLRGIVDDPDRRLSALPLLAADERHRLLAEWNDTAAALPLDEPYARQFEAQAARTPDAIAAVADEGSLTYRELDARANRLAGRLVAAGVGPDRVVALLGERSLDFLTWILAVFKAGGAYLPLDPRHPAARHAAILTSSAAVLVLVDDDDGPALEAALAEMDVAGRPAILRAAETRAAGGGEGQRVAPRGGSGDLAYVIYTSGSTGVPKGAMVEQVGMLNHLHAKIRDLNLTAADTVVQNASQCFDISVWQFLAPLLVGGRVRIVSDDVAADAPRLLALVDREGIGVIEVVPSVLASAFPDGVGVASTPALTGLRWLIVTGEAAPPALCRRWLHEFPHTALMNGYGPTECSDDVTHHVITEPPAADATQVPIGRPIANMRIYVVDRELAPMPIGVPGELCVGGIGVGRGYLGDPVRTAEAFVADPFTDRAGARLYRTGDLARWRSDGMLEFLGRLDHQVKVRGFRIELGEIEAALGRHPAVREVVVVAREDPRGERRLVAYVVTGEEAPPADLRAFVARSLPDYMLPESVVLLSALPLTPNGKVDRRALPEPELPARPLASVPPRTPAEEVIANVWSEVLGIQRVGIHENFFELGGHSLLATRVISRLREAFAIDLPVRRMFEAPTVAGLAGHVEAARRTTTPVPTPPLRALPRTGALPLSFAQARLWFFEQLEPGSAVYNMPLVLSLRGRLDMAALELSLTEIARRHETLRAMFPSRDGVAFVSTAPASSWSVGVIDLTDHAADQRDAEAEKLAIEEAARPFDIAAGPLVRARVLRLDDERHLLVVTFHHIIVDGWGLDVFMRELAALYASHVTGHTPALPPLPVQYGDFAAWQREWLSGEALAQQLAYWTRQLAGAPAALDLPVDRVRPLIQTFRGGGCVRRIDPAVREALHALGRRENATIFMTLLAAFGALLGRQSGQDDVCVGVPVAGRVRPELENLIGLFVNTLVFRVRLDDSPSFRALLGQVRETSLGAYAHQDIPFEKLVEELQPPRDLGRTPLFQVLFNMMNFGDSATLDLPGLHVEPAALSARAWEVQSKFDLTLYARDDPSGLTFVAVYNADLFADERMADLLDQLVQLLTAVAADPDVDIRTPSLLTPAAARVVPDPTAALAAVWTESLSARFRRYARRAPHHPAVVTPTRTWSYSELEASSNQLARHLNGHGVGRGDLVAIYADRSAGLAWALLGVLKAGAAFMCLDSAYPAARAVACLQAAPPRAFIHLEGAGPVPEAIGEHLTLIGGLLTVTWPARAGATTAAWSAGATEAPVHDVGPEDLAYVVFTSGSTGVPKAIAGTHGPLAHFFEWHRRTSGLGEGDRFAALSGLAHDPLLRDVLGAFWVGAAVCMPDPTWLATAGSLERWLQDQRISVAHVTPGVAALLPEGGPSLPSLRHVFFGGDVLTASMVDRVRRVAPHARCVNFYGATETPQAVASYRVPETAPGVPATIPLGQGIEGAQLLVVNDAGELAGIGELGEIQVRTPNLSRGYLNDSVLTAERFVVNPFTKAPDDRVYRTGDLGRYRPDGTVEFVGRRDGQIKLRGFRIELGDVEAALRRCPGVAEAVAQLRQEAGRDAQLVAYVVGTGGTSPIPEQLRRWLGSELPGPMVPAIFIAVERIPLTPNGKVDLAALPAPPARTSRERRAPRTPTELALAEIWCDVLAIESVDVEGNFFELGGHSLLAVTLFSRIEKVFGVTLPLATLFQAPTLERQAELIDQRGLDAPWQALVPIQPAGSRPPLFAIPGLGGIVVVFNDLATLLGPDQPFYALQPRGLDGKLPPFESIEETAEHYLTEVRALQPQGPYFFMGVCMGGLVAFEMAQRLRAAGQEVAFLALLDVRPPHPMLRWMPAVRPRLSVAVVGLVAKRLASAARSLLQRPSMPQARELIDRIKRAFANVSAGDPLRGVRGEVYHQIVTAANSAAMGRYHPQPYPGSLVLVLAADRRYTRGSDRRMAWRELATGGADICVVPGADSGLTLVEPNVRTLAEEFRARLQRVREGTMLTALTFAADHMMSLLAVGGGA